MCSTGFSGIAVPRFGLSLLFAEPIHSSSNRLTAFPQEDLHRIPLVAIVIIGKAWTLL